MHHFITYIDFRFHKPVFEYLQENNYLGACDIISIAGSSRDFLVPLETNHKDYIWRQLEISLSLHDPDEIILIDHQDCGGYAQDNTIPANLEIEDDKQKHLSITKPLITKIKEKYPDKILKYLYVDLNKNITEIPV